MAQCVVLSVLIHALVVVLFGNASGVGRQSNQWGSSFLARLDPANLRSPGASTRESRRTSRQSNQSSADDKASDANAESVTRETALDGASEPLLAAATETITPAASSVPAAPPTPTPLPMVPMPPMSSLERLPELNSSLAATTGSFAVAPLVLEPLVAPQPSVTPSFPVITPLPPATGSTSGFAIYVPPIVERAAAVPSTAKPLQAPTLPSLAAPTVDREFAQYVPPALVPRPVVSLPVESISRSVAADAPAVAPTPTYKIEPIEPLELKPTARALAPYVAPTAAASQTLTPPAAPTAAASPTLTPQVTHASATSTTGVDARTDADAKTSSPRANEIRDAQAATAPVPSSAMSTLFSGPPLPPPVAPPAPPRLDLDALRRQAREVSREGSGPRTLLPFPTVAKVPPKRDIEKIFDKALARPDCKDAYADLGLAAVVPLVRDAVKDGGCKW
jgi:hypothetical protein